MVDVTVVGSFNQDLTFFSDSFPAPGETRIGHFQAGPGGKGFNQAVACQRAGARVVFVGAVGKDSFADDMQTFAASEGLNLELEICDHEPTGAAGIVVNKQAENLIVVALGANNQLSRQHVLKVLPQLTTSKVLLCQVESNLDATLAALSFGQQRNIVTVLNPAPINDGLSLELLSHADILTPNETEFVFLMQHVFGQSVPEDFWQYPDEQLHEYCKQVPVATVILTLGKQGCFVSQNPSSGQAGYFRVPAITVDTVDTTGAGDAFNGGLATGLVRYNQDLHKAVEFASVVAGLSTTKIGTAPAMPYPNEIEPQLNESEES